MPNSESFTPSSTRPPFSSSNVTNYRVYVDEPIRFMAVSVLIIVVPWPETFIRLVTTRAFTVSCGELLFLIQTKMPCRSRQAGGRQRPRSARSSAGLALPRNQRMIQTPSFSVRPFVDTLPGRIRAGHAGRAAPDSRLAENGRRGRKPRFALAKGMPASCEKAHKEVNDR